MTVKPVVVVRLLISWVALIVLLFVLNWARSAATSEVVVLTLDGAVTPATADYVVRGMRKAAERDAALVVLKLDTPGGLDTSMRSIIKAILASSVPVATFVAPDGARAASAGTYILYASHVAAMAPATNLGAATPVAIGIGDDGLHAARQEGEGQGAKRRRRATACATNRSMMRRLTSAGWPRCAGATQTGRRKRCARP